MEEVKGKGEGKETLKLEITGEDVAWNVGQKSQC